MEQQQQQDGEFQQKNQNNNDVLLNTFLISNRKYRVLLHHENLTWEKENSRNGKTTVPLIDMLAVQIGGVSRHNNNGSSINDSRISINPSISSSPATNVPTIRPDSTKNHLYIHYARREINCHRDQNRWRKHTLKLYSTDYHIIQIWYDTLSVWLGEQKRPKNILMFINPYGGKRQALKVYERYSKPLFQLAGVEVSCLISQRSNQIHDILLNNSALDQYDGICCVGGDGTFAEVFNGLMQRQLKDLNLDSKRPKYLPKLRIPIGMIPAGSTDTVAYCLHGTTDVKTAVIHIILGQTGGLDLSSVCNHDGLVRLYASLVCYGYLGDIALDSEQYRWMGPRRYDYSGLKKFLANRAYEIELSFPEIDNRSSSDPDGDGNDENTLLTCNIGCAQCSNVVETSEQTHVIDYSMLKSIQDTVPIHQVNDNTIIDENNKWKTIHGKYFMVAGANISCASSRSPNGLAPFCHLGDGHLDIILVRHTHVFNLLRLLLRLNRENPQIDMLPFVDSYRTNKFIVRSPKSSSSATTMASTSDLAQVSGSRQPISSTKKSTTEQRTSQWNCDGEIIFNTDVLISSHRQLVDVFMRGSYPPEMKKSSCCGLCGS